MGKNSRQEYALKEKVLYLGEIFIFYFFKYFHHFKFRSGLS